MLKKFAALLVLSIPTAFFCLWNVSRGQMLFNKCESLVYFQASSWTLYYLLPDNVIQSRADCHSFLSSYKKALGRRVKRVSFYNKTVMNLGCTAKTAMCKERPHWDYSLNTRVNTPPCCQKKALLMYQRLSQELRKHKIVHCMMYGGVLGYVRNKQMTPYDIDLDMMIEKSYWDSELFNKILKDLWEKYGHISERIFENTQMHLYYSTTNRVYIDVWPYEIKERRKGKKIFIYHLENMEQDFDTIFPLKLSTFSGFKTYFPRDSLKYVEVQYGKGAVEKEYTCKRMNNGQCVDEKM